MRFRVPMSEIPTNQKITGFLAHSTLDNGELGNYIDNETTT